MCVTECEQKGAAEEGLIKRRKEVLGTSLLKDCMKKYEFNFFFCLGSFVGEKGWLSILNANIKSEYCGQ